MIHEIAEAVAHSKGVEPAELDLVLSEHIDIDALTQLADHDTSTWTLTFELPEHTLTVTSDRTILVDGEQETDWIPA